MITMCMALPGDTDDAVFADTCYWVALYSPGDDLHAAAINQSQRLHGASLLTTEEVLGEVLTLLGGRGEAVRRNAAVLVRDVLADESTEVRPQSHETFDSAVQLFSRRPDKEYSFVDCASFSLMRERGITRALTADRHFEQEGFTALLRRARPR